MKCYPTYRVSDKEWIEEYPAHWTIIRNKYILREVETRSETGKETLLSLTKEKGLIPQAEYSDRGSSALTLVGYRLCMPGQIVMNKMQAWNGMFGLVKTPGLVSPDYTVLQPIHDINPEFLLYLFKTQKMISVFYQHSRGIGTGFKRLYTSDFGDISIALPPHIEQEAIVTFLEHMMGKIDRFVINKKRLIELLKKQKAAIINRALTHGLDPNVPMKPSGVEWLGQIPTHWEVKRAKYIFREINQRSETGLETHLSMSQKLGLVETNRIEEKTLQSETQEGFKLCHVDDLVLNRLKAHLGVFARATIPGLVSPDYTVFRLKVDANVQYFDALYKHPAYIAAFNKAVRGIVIGFLRLYTPEFNDIRTLFPPKEEQDRIIGFIQDKTAIIDRIISRANREIELIKEFRMKLISDVVTGKLDVRDVESSYQGRVGKLAYSVDKMINNTLVETQELEHLGESIYADN